MIRFWYKNFIIWKNCIVKKRHRLTGRNLEKIDSNQYPYCEICGARPKENYIFYWYYRKHVELRNILNIYNNNKAVYITL